MRRQGHATADPQGASAIGLHLSDGERSRREMRRRPMEQSSSVIALRKHTPTSEFGFNRLKDLFLAQPKTKAK